MLSSGHGIRNMPKYIYRTHLNLIGTNEILHVCICGYVYDENDGAPDDGIEPGTKWEDVPETWLCPDCGARKEDFEMVEI